MTMTENHTPTAEPTTDAAAEPIEQPAARRTVRGRLPSGRKAVAAGAVLAGLAICGAGFWAGYAVAENKPSDTATTQTTNDGWSDRGFPGDGRGPMGGMPGGGQMGGMPGGTQDGADGTGGTTGEAPDFDGDGEPDTESGTDSSSGTNSG